MLHASLDIQFTLQFDVIDMTVIYCFRPTVFDNCHNEYIVITVYHRCIITCNQFLELITDPDELFLD